MEFGGEEGMETSSSSSQLCQCRICHEEEEEESKTMEAPCSCSGSLKFAHRGCIQRWCHEKGSTICEICLQKFEPGYTLPPKVPQFVDMVVTIRGNLEAPQLNYQLEAISSGDEAVYEHPECSPSSRRGASCYRYVALAVTIVLLFKHSIDVTTVKANHYPFTLETVLLLRSIGILLPFYLAMRIITAIQRAQRRHQLHGLMTCDDRDEILRGLDEIERRIEAGEFVWRTDREDVHMNIEASLTDMIGEPAKKLHTARSRNDQIVTDLRLWCRDTIDKLIVHIRQLQVALVSLAIQNEGLIVPGYTHLQRAQPVLLQHLLLSYVEQLDRDASRLSDCKDRMNYCPLGACALAGTGLPINRFLTSDALGFTAPMRNSIDAVSDRDFVLEFLSANSIAAIHLSRLGEEWVLWASEEFGFLTPSDSVSTGSSIMPQKKNPDPMELVRGKSARVVGQLVTLLVLCKGLPQAYNRDLQEDKEPLFNSVKTVTGMLEVTSEFAQNITFNRVKIEKALPAGHLDATTLADYLVKKGIPFRTSHDIVGRSVALCVVKNCQLSDLTLDELRSINPVFENDVYDFLGVENCVKKFCSYGSTGSQCVGEQLSYWVAKLQSH